MSMLIVVTLLVPLCVTALSPPTTVHVVDDAVVSASQRSQLQKARVPAHDAGAALF